jgi:hypothetical protein
MRLDLANKMMLASLVLEEFVRWYAEPLVVAF